MAPADLRIEVVYCAAPGAVEHHGLRLPPGATVADALQASGLQLRAQAADEPLTMGVWGRVCNGGTALRDRDRVEVYRGLQVDPKEARRLRYQKHRAQKAPGAPPGR